MMLLEGVTVIDAWELETDRSTRSTISALIAIQFILSQYNLIQIYEL